MVPCVLVFPGRKGLQPCDLSLARGVLRPRGPSWVLADDCSLEQPLLRLGPTDTVYLTGFKFMQGNELCSEVLSSICVPTWLLSALFLLNYLNVRRVLTTCVTTFWVVSPSVGCTLFSLVLQGDV